MNILPRSLFQFGLLCWTSFFSGKKLFANYNILGRVLQGGGIALGYLTLYAAFFFENTSIFKADIVGYIVLFIYLCYFYAGYS